MRNMKGGVLYSHKSTHKTEANRACQAMGSRVLVAKFFLNIELTWMAPVEPAEGWVGRS